MKIRRKSWISAIAILGSIVFLSGFFFCPAQAQKAIEWRVLSGWGPENPNVREIFMPFVEKVNQRAVGRLKISWLGPEAVPPFEQIKPVREGLFDAVYTSASYHLGEVAVGTGMGLFSATGKERRAAGLLKILDEAYRKKANVTYLAGMPDGVGYNLLLKKKIDKADLTGLKIRTAPLYDPMVNALGGAPVRIAMGEIYSALEKGVVDGVMQMAIGALDYKWYEVVKYMVRPRFGEVVIELLVNLDSWNRLSKDLQDLLTRAAIEAEEEGRSAMIRLLEKEESELQKRGMELLVLPPKEAKKYLDTFYESSWGQLVLKPDPVFGPRFKEAVDRMRKK